MPNTTAGKAGPLHRLANNIYVLWALLALPGAYLVVHGLLVRGKVDFYLGWSGEISCWLLIAALMVTPLMQLLGPLPWLKARRRYLGVASCMYALLHLAVWLAEANVRKLIQSFVRPEVLPGWIALAILTGLALISTDRAVRRLGPRWKFFQRWVYLAAILTLAHWLLVTEFAARVWIYASPPLLLSAWRLLRYSRRANRT